MNIVQRSLVLFAGLVVFIVLVGLWQGVANISLLLLQATAFALIALGLNLQFGYGGLFNFGIMGFLMIGGFAVTFISYPLNMKFWGSDGPRTVLVTTCEPFQVFAVKNTASFVRLTATWRPPGAFWMFRLYWPRVGL